MPEDQPILVDLMNQAWVKEFQPLAKRDLRAENIAEWFQKEKLKITTTINYVGEKFAVKVILFEPETGINICYVVRYFTKEELMTTQWRGSVLNELKLKLFDIHKR